LPLEDIRPATQAAWREARHKLQVERGTHVSDDELLAVLCGVYLDGAAPDQDDQHAGRARYQVAVSICPGCQQGWRDGAGRTFPLDAADTERALCDAQHVGSLDGNPARATQDIAPRVRRFVVRRDRGACRVPGCRSTANLELHHIVPRSRGGSHEASNLIQLCDGCHTAHHRGLLDIRGTSDDLEVTRRHAFVPTTLDADSAHVGVDPIARHVGVDPRDRVHVGFDPWDRVHVDVGSKPIEGVHTGDGPIDHAASTSPIDRGASTSPIDSTHVGVDTIDRTHVGARHRSGVFDRVAARTQALDALVTLGFKRHEARAYVDGAIAELGPRAFDLETVLRAALRRVPHK
jgi:5-methylcytosine-specific restriction endonuclease McrA